MSSNQQNGLTRVDFQLPDVIDGGSPIANFPGRIYDLKEQGHRIGENGRRNKCKVYVLLEQATVPVPPAQFQPPATDTGTGLFPKPPRLAIFDEPMEDVA